MEEEELDPAFLDMPSPSMLSGGFGNELGELELGSGFGSALSDDLGAGFGNAISSSHSDDEYYGHPSTPPSRSRHGSDDALGHDDDGQSAGLTPRRRAAGSAAPSPNSNRLSLAFELASASSPGRSNSRDLLRELGIEEEERGSGGDEERYDSEEEELEVEGELEMAGRRAPRRPSESAQLGKQLQDVFAGAGSATTRRIASTSSTIYQDSTPSVNTPDDEAAQEARDTSLSESSAALESSLATTGVFLSHLRQHTTAEIDPHAASSSPSSSTAEPCAPVDYTDRQPLVESLASSVVKSMYDLAKQREGQVRELVEMERSFARNEVGWQAALAQLEELPRDEDERSQDGEDGGVDMPEEGAADSTNTSSDSTSTPAPSALSDDFPLPNGASPPSSPHSEPAIRPPPATTTSSALAELSSLRDITSSLVAALSAMNEVTQVTQAATGDAGRKLRALRGQLMATRDDLQGNEKSEEFVADFEAREERRARIGGKSRAEEVREEMKEAERALEEGWSKAQVLLTVVA